MNKRNWCRERKSNKIQWKRFQKLENCHSLTSSDHSYFVLYHPFIIIFLRIFCLKIYWISLSLELVLSDISGCRGAQTGMKIHSKNLCRNEFGYYDVCC